MRKRYVYWCDLRIDRPPEGVVPVVTGNIATWLSYDASAYMVPDSENHFLVSFGSGLLTGGIYHLLSKGARHG